MPKSPRFLAKLTTSSALNPLIYLVLGLGVICCGLATLGSTLAHWLLGLIATAVVAIFGIFVYLMLKNPTLLGSEKHWYDMALLGDERRNREAIDITPTANTHFDEAKALGDER